MKLNDIKIISKIDKGAFSTVYCCEIDNKKYALKKYKEKYNYCGEKEFEILEKLKSNNINNQNSILNIISKIYSNNNLYLIMELGEVNLYKYYSNNDILLSDFKSISKQLINGLSYIHDFIIHADLKPENIIINNNEQIKIIDFGSSFLLEDIQKYNNKQVPYIQSRYYRAPEILYRLCIDTKNDIWSLGCILYEILIKKPLFPFSSENEMIYGIAKIMGTPHDYDNYINCNIFKEYFYYSDNFYYFTKSIHLLKDYNKNISTFLYSKLIYIFDNNTVNKIVDFLSPMLKYNVIDKDFGGLLIIF
jgi:serine/threonine protein kinase